MKAIEIKNLSKTFKETKAVDDISINVEKGSIYGFLGPNGAGKTTTIKMITGLIKPDAGSIYIDGEKSEFSKFNKNINIGFLPDVPEYYSYMKSWEFLQLCAKLYEMNDIKKRVDEVIEISGLKGVKSKIGSYSRGMKQRLGLAQALISKPSVIILDEPTSALDPVGRKEMLDLIYSMKGIATVLFSTHILSDVERICDTVGIINKGKLLVEDNIENLKNLHNTKNILLNVNGNSFEKIKSVFENTSWVDSVKKDNNQTVLSVNDIDKAQNDIARVLYENRISLKSMSVEEPDLEKIFIKVVNSR